MAGKRRPRGRRARVFIRAVTAGCFLAYLLALSPHLVHHLLEESRDQGYCPHFALSQQTPEAQMDPPALLPPDPARASAACLTRLVLLVRDLPARHPRAPPAPAST